VPVVALCGLWAQATTEVANRLLAEHRDLHPVHYAATGPVPGLDASSLVSVPEGWEPDELRAAWREGGPPHVVTVVAADFLLDGLTDETPLRALDLHRAPNDRRSVGELVARQIEQADTVVLAGQPEGADEWEAEQVRVLLRRLAPWSRHSGIDDVQLSVAGRAEPVAAVTRGLRGRAAGVHEPLPDHGVAAWVFRARRPFHPTRLHDALDEVTDGVLRSRGTFWLASRPDVVMIWESAGGLGLGPHSGWLAELPGEHWDGVDPERRLAAAVDWDPYYGDRQQHLAFVGIDVDAARVQRTLGQCLLTDPELADGSESWTELPDPFAPCFNLATTDGNQH
jgi:G3E family GTPase